MKHIQEEGALSSLRVMLRRQRDVGNDSNMAVLFAVLVYQSQVQKTLMDPLFKSSRNGLETWCWWHLDATGTILTASAEGKGEGDKSTG